SYHAAQSCVSQFLNISFQRLEDYDTFHLRHMIGGIADVMPVGLKLVVIPRCGCDDDIGKLPYQFGGRLLMVSVLCRAILHVAAACIEKSWMRFSDGDDVSAHVTGHSLDMARHRRGIIHVDLVRVNFALHVPVHHGGEKLPAISEMVRRRYAC